MIVSFNYKPFLGVTSHYSGKLLNPKRGIKVTFQVALPKGVADFVLHRVATEDKLYMMSCIEAELAYLEMRARVEYANIIYKRRRHDNP
jgi:hypothetical protein